MSARAAVCTGILLVFVSSLLCTLCPGVLASSGKKSHVIYRSDHRWGPYRAISGGLQYRSEDGIHYTCSDSTVRYSRPYWYRFEDAYIGSATPDSLPQPTLPGRPTGLVAADVTADCGNTIYLSWEASAGADSYYVFRCPAMTFDECTPVPQFLGATTSPSYTDTTTSPDDFYSYSVVAWNETGSSEESVADTAMSVQNFEGVSPARSQVSVSDDSILACPGGDADSLTIDVTLLDVCGGWTDTEDLPHDVYAVLTEREGNVRSLDGDTLWPVDNEEEVWQQVEMVAYHIGGCGRVKVCVYADGRLLAQQPIVVLRSPDLNADGVVNSLDQKKWILGDDCTDLNWDGIEGDSRDRAIFNSHLLHNGASATAIKLRNESE